MPRYVVQTDVYFECEKDEIETVKAQITTALIVLDAVRNVDVDLAELVG